MPTQEQPVSQKSGRPTISVCMIVKNEEKFLAQCLKSVKDAADERLSLIPALRIKRLRLRNPSGAKVYHHPLAQQLQRGAKSLPTLRNVRLDTAD